MFSEVPEPEACRRMMATCMPRGWFHQMSKKSLLQLADIQSCNELQSISLNNVVNMKAREMAFDLEKKQKEIELLRGRVLSEQAIATELSEKLKVNVEASEPMKRAREQVKELQEVAMKQDEELRILRQELEGMTAVRRELEEKSVALEAERAKVVEAVAEAAKHQGRVWEVTQENVELRGQLGQTISEVIPHVCNELVKSEELGILIAELVRLSRKWERSIVLEELAISGEKVVLDSRDDYDKNAAHEADVAVELLANATFPYVQEVSANPNASVEELLSIKPKSSSG